MGVPTLIFCASVCSVPGKASPKARKSREATWVTNSVNTTQAASTAGLEVKVSPHWLRHSHATHALERGAPIHLVAATLGHASVATTGKYLHARPTDSSARYLVV
jgi:site-specific recombinase XerD